MKYFNRQEYTNKIKPFIGKQIIKVLTGQRRVGKSYLLFQLMDVIREENPSANIVYINRELEEFIHIRTHSDLMEYLKDKWKEKAANFLFIDEVQEIESFQLALRSLSANDTCDIFCTGSNAKILSSELATYLAGRYIEFNIHSLSFKEFLHFHKLTGNSENLMKYLTFGGMPYLTNIGLNEDLPFEYLRNVYSAILLKDIVARENIRNVAFLENLVVYLADNVGNLFSAANISKFLKSQGVVISPQLTINYLKALSNAYFIHKVVRSEIGGLKIFEIGEKYYFEDLGLRNVIMGVNRKTDIQKLMGNAVFLYLLGNGYQVYVGKIRNNEIDFVADKKGGKIYVQVTLQLTEETTIQREFSNLLKINDNYPKYVVTFNDVLIGRDFKGITQINLLDFLQLVL
jgi:predicted AAA+ superfamily ATPase